MKRRRRLRVVSNTVKLCKIKDRFFLKLLLSKPKKWRHFSFLFYHLNFWGPFYFLVPQSNKEGKKIQINTHKTKAFKATETESRATTAKNVRQMEEKLPTSGNGCFWLFLLLLGSRWILRSSEFGYRIFKERMGSGKSLPWFHRSVTATLYFHKALKMSPHPQDDIRDFQNPRISNDRFKLIRNQFEMRCLKFDNSGACEFEDLDAPAWEGTSLVLGSW